MVLLPLWFLCHGGLAFALKLNNIEVYGGSYREAFESAHIVPQKVRDVRVINGTFTKNDLEEFNATMLNCTALETLVFEENVIFENNTITTDMFGPIKCTTIEFACSSLDTIQKFPMQCTNLIINKIKNINGYAFENVSVSTVEANSMTYIHGMAFRNSKILSGSFPKAESVNVGAFEDSFGLQNVTFGTLNRIRNYAFYGCQSLTSIDCKLSTDIEINYYAFYSCSKLTKFDTSLLRKIDDSCFARCLSLVTVDLANAEVIEHDAFRQCYSLQNLYAPKVTNIDYQAFIACYSLTSVVCKNLTEIGYYCFTNCKLLENVTCGTVNSVGDKAFENCVKLMHIDWTLSENITIEYEAFQNCRALQSFKDMGKVKVITACCFTNCEGLRSVDLSSAVKIGTNAFLGCLNLTRVVAPVAEEVGSGAFAFCLSMEYISMPQLEVINEMSFAEMPHLSEIDFPMAKEMTQRCFHNCYCLRSVNLSVTMVGRWNFRYCHGLRNVTLDSAMSLESSNFENCTNLEYVRMNNLKECNQSAFAGLNLIGFYGESLVTIPEKCFASCQMLEDVVITNCEVIEKEAFRNIACLNQISLPKLRILGDLAFYDSCELSISVGPYLEEIGNQALASISLCTVDIQGFPDTEPPMLKCKRIGSCAFNKTRFCYDGVCNDIENELTKMMIFNMFNEDYIEDLSDSYVFPSYVKESVVDLTFPSLRTARNYPFSGWKILRSINLSALTTCDAGLFMNCSLLESISLDNLTSIENGALFSNCPKLTTLTLPKLSSASNNAFSWASGLVSVHAPMISVIGESAFSGCRSLLEINGDKTVDIQGVTSIGVSAFSDCASIREIKLGEVKEIKNCTFCRCESLVSISVEHVQDLYASAFEDCHSLQSLNFQNLVSLYGDRQFANCVRLESIHTQKLMNVYSDHAQEIFANCSSLGSIFLGSDPPEFNENVFLNTNRGYIEIDGEKFINLTLCVEGHDYSKYQSECDSDGKDCESFRWNGLYANQDEDFSEVCGIPGKSWFARNLYWIIPALIASVCAAVICVGVFLYIRKHDREKDEMYHRMALSRLVLDDFG